MSNSDHKPLLTISEVADYFRVSRDTVVRMIKDGTLQAMDIGRGRPMYRICSDSLNNVPRNGTIERAQEVKSYV